MGQGLGRCYCAYEGCSPTPGEDICIHCMGTNQCLYAGAPVARQV